MSSKILCNQCPDSWGFRKTHSIGHKYSKQVMTQYANNEIDDSVFDDSIVMENVFLYRDQEISVTADPEKDAAYHIVIWFEKCGYFNMSEIARDFPELHTKVMQFISNSLLPALKLKEIKIWQSERIFTTEDEPLHAHIQISSGDSHVPSPETLYNITGGIFTELWKS